MQGSGLFQKQQKQQQQPKSFPSTAKPSASHHLPGRSGVSNSIRRQGSKSRVSSSLDQLQLQQEQQIKHLQRNSSTAKNSATGRGPLTTNNPLQGLPTSSAAGNAGEFHIDLGDLTQTPRRRTSSVPAASLRTYRFLRRCLGLLACFVSVADLTLGVADIVIGISMTSGRQFWVCSNAYAGASVLASGITGCLFCLSMVNTQWLAVGNTVVHSSITVILMLISLSHTCSALPRLQFSYQAGKCDPYAAAYLWLTSLGRLTTLLFTGAYYYVLNYFSCRFGEDNSSSSGGSGVSSGKRDSK